jgi:hypothetical protein
MKIKILVLFTIFVISISQVSAICIKNIKDSEENIKICKESEISPINYDKSNLLKGRTIVNLIEQLDETIMLQYLENITSFGQRATGSKAIEKVANYIKNELSDLGLWVKYHEWNDLALSGKNIEATLNGTNKNSDKIYIICGHYDGVPNTMGADDNGAGAVSVMCAARILSKYKFNDTIKFILFSGEEQGLFGSYHYALDAAKRNDNIVGVINIDMTGYSSNVEDGKLVYLFENYKSQWISQSSQNMCEKYKNYLDLDVSIKKNRWAVSDHFGFWQNDYDAIFYYESEKNPSYHQPGDNMGTVNITYATKVAKLALSNLIDIVGIPRPIIGKTINVGGRGPANYSTINEALNIANNSDIIYVYNGTYNEKISISKSIDLIGESSENTIIINNKTSAVIEIFSDYTYISGFDIKNKNDNWGDSGINISSDYNVVIDNIITDINGNAIGLQNALWTDIFYNNISNNTDGITLYGKSQFSRIHHNKINNNKVCGVALFAQSDETCIKYNVISKNLHGILTEPAGKSDEFGNPKNLNIYKNEIIENGHGIYLLMHSKSNRIIQNNFTNNKVGLFLGEKSNRNLIFKNNFIRNEIHATFDACFFNIWLRNYWSNRTINLGPAIIKGFIRTKPWTPELKWYAFDYFPALKAYDISI